MMERELGEGYSFTKKKCFVCGSLSHLIKDCDYYEKKMAREAEVKRVVNTGNGVTKPVWTNANRINHSNKFVPRSVQLNAGRPKFNSVRPNINTGRTNINSGRPKVNTVSPKVNTVRSRQPVPHKTSNSEHPLKNMVDRGIILIGMLRAYEDNQYPRSGISYGCLILTILLLYELYLYFLPVSLENQAKPHAGASEVTNSAERKEEILTTYKEEAFSMTLLKKSLRFKLLERLEEIALKHLEKYLKTPTTSTTSVNYDLPHGRKVIGNKKGLRNKRDERGVVISDEFHEELTFFLGLQVKQNKGGIFISQYKYVGERLKKFDLVNVKAAITPMETKVPLTKDEESFDVDVTPKTSHLNAVKRIFKYLKGKPNLGLWYPRESPFDLEAFSDSDYGGSNLDRKSTTGGCQFLGQRLISWQCKKQTIVATSTTEAEYVAAANCCGQVLWVQNQLLDYGFNFMNTKIHIDNESTICIVKNPVYHSKTKHIEIRHHFIRDCYEKKLISVEKIHTDLNVADLLTKPFDGPRFNYLVVSIGFAEIVDFLRGSNLRYALTSNPTIYDSLVKQFWQTATTNTIADGTLEIHATIDTIGYTITEASIRDTLQLADATGITMLPNDEIFEGMGQMGSKSGGWDQFGSNIATALICLSTDRVYNFSKLIFDGMVANLKSKTKFLMYPRFLQLILNIQTENKHLYLAVTLTKKIFGNMKRGFRGAPRPLLPAMLLVATTNPNAGQEHHPVTQTQPSSSTLPVPSTSSPPVQSPPIPASIPSPTPIPETEPEPFEHAFEEPSPFLDFDIKNGQPGKRDLTQNQADEWGGESISEVESKGEEAGRDFEKKEIGLSRLLNGRT
ncbi:hypothetical protein Tco_0267623 [Tanacetum coccineum]